MPYELKSSRQSRKTARTTSTVTVPNELRVTLKKFLLDHPLAPTTQSAVAIAIDQWISSEIIKIERGDYRVEVEDPDAEDPDAVPPQRNPYDVVLPRFYGSGRSLARPRGWHP